MRERARDLIDALGEQFGRREEDRAAGDDGIASQAGNASAAAAAAWAASEAVALGKVARTSSALAGFLVSKLAWSLAPTHSPPIRFLQASIVHPAVAMSSARLATTILRTAATAAVVPGVRWGLEQAGPPEAQPRPGSGTSVWSETRSVSR